MKIWKSILATASVFYLGVAASEIEVEIGSAWNDELDMLITRQTAPVSSNDEPLPCNGFPEYRDLPVNHFFWLGAHNAGSHDVPKFKQQAANVKEPHACQYKSQDRTITEMLTDGLRFLQVNVCKTKNDKLSLCSPTGVQMYDTLFQDFIDEVLDFIRMYPQQIIMVHVSASKKPKQPVTAEALEGAIDEVCKVHTDRTLGTDEFKRHECPFIYTHPFAARPWPTMGELINYDPDMPQWEGDGQHVGVQSQLVLTYDDRLASSLGQKSHYFSQPFWESGFKVDQQLKDVDDNVRELCKKSGALQLNAFLPETTVDCNSHLNEKFYTPAVIDRLLLSKDVCDFNNLPSTTYFSGITVDCYEQHLPFLLNLQRQMVAINYAKLNGRKVDLKPSPVKEEKLDTQSPYHHERDEL
ncbi:uncharacterized protein BYT42DRAFT_557777 [Radiomyces spectabilis]|uniref:uncharacterized protein n=1 Tax=Radiomyces spectabilis TaxID=64574 RepID=UPI00221F69E0|nr:uncharacterized protein BYT42DRAFT_557777 [Radiomyces spectabilis]KAI8391710.1 hypothetical protein BYT42DRAFT_557777 [Radiomyces spectabilis]